MQSQFPAKATLVFSAPGSACFRRSHICSLFRLASLLMLSSGSQVWPAARTSPTLSAFSVFSEFLTSGSQHKLDKTINENMSPDQHPPISKPCWPYPHRFLPLHGSLGLERWLYPSPDQLHPWNSWVWRSHACDPVTGEEERRGSLGLVVLPVSSRFSERQCLKKFRGSALLLTQRAAAVTFDAHPRCHMCV